MYNLMVTFRCLPGKREAFVEKMQETGILEAVRKEDGCHRYEYFFCQENENILLLLEAWESKEHQQIHISQPHMDKLRSFKAEYIEDTAIEAYSLV